MKASKSEHEPSIAPINPIYESTIEPEQFATEDLRHDYEDLFRKNIELIKLERFTVENTEVDALKHILRLLTYCVSILAVLGLLHVVVDRAREAKRDKREYGGSFMIFGEADIDQEDNEVTLRRKVELMSKYKQSFEEIEKDDLQRIEIENQKHKEAKENSIWMKISKKLGIAIVRGNEVIPQKISFNEMINLKGVTEERIVKFFFGKDIIEFVGVGIKKLPKDIKVMAMSQGSYKVYKSDNQERKGEEVTQLISWSD
ncbi:MAG: hypothetical protein EZS28_022003 [Streblomastix strix]|uniref:Uncharacterized protein n=1 Tax=Streblomastix strix TaxID=222440 RepID=A0A5J4VIR7_9EUKA|nr:MAG: hypothetical protein EZS28_022003 [Streblomastix strix]